MSPDKRKTAAMKLYTPGIDDVMWLLTAFASGQLAIP